MLLIFAIAEAVSVQLVSVWFAGGAAAALIAGSLHAPLWLQITVFVVVTAILLIFTRPAVKRLMKSKNSETNLDRIIGHSVIITQKVDNDAQTGGCTIAGVSWSVRSLDGEVFEPGEKVVVDHVEGVRLIVKR